MVYIQLGRETILEIDMMFFSIIIPLYNKVGQIRTTLESVLSQSLRDFELIVVNDGSTDGSDSIVSSIHDSRVRLINKNNGGVSSARNVGVKNANGDWIILLDADDIMLPDALLNMSKMIQKHPHDLYFSGRTKWKGEVGRKITNRIKKTYWPFFHIWTRTIDPAPRCVVLHRSLFDRYGNYDERMSFYEDWELSLRLACCGSIVYTDTYFALYTPNDKGLGSKKHPITKEMAYYIPQMNIYSFWHKALLYENLQMAKLWWTNHNEETEYYNKVEETYFDRCFRVLHWIRQKMISIGFI